MISHILVLLRKQAFKYGYTLLPVSLYFGAIKLFKTMFLTQSIVYTVFQVIIAFLIFGNGRHLHKRATGKNYAILKSLRSNNYCRSPKKIACAC